MARLRFFRRAMLCLLGIGLFATPALQAIEGVDLLPLDAEMTMEDLPEGAECKEVALRGGGAIWCSVEGVSYWFRDNRVISLVWSYPGIRASGVISKISDLTGSEHRIERSGEGEKYAWLDLGSTPPSRITLLEHTYQEINGDIGVSIWLAREPFMPISPERLTAFADELVGRNVSTIVSVNTRLKRDIEGFLYPLDYNTLSIKASLDRALAEDWVDMFSGFDGRFHVKIYGEVVSADNMGAVRMVTRGFSLSSENELARLRERRR